MRISDWSSDVCSSDLQDISIHLTLELTKSISNLEIAPSRIDIGRMATEWLNEDNKRSIEAFVNDKLSKHIGKNARILTPKDVEIGRASCRERGCQYV